MKLCARGKRRWSTGRTRRIGARDCSHQRAISSHSPTCMLQKVYIKHRPTWADPIVGPSIGQHGPISAHVGPYRPTLWQCGMTRGQLACQLAPLLTLLTFHAAAEPEKRRTRQHSESTRHDQVGSSRQGASSVQHVGRRRRTRIQPGVSTPPTASKCWNRVKHCLHEGALVMLNMVVECQPCEVMRTGEKKVEYRQNKAYWRKRLFFETESAGPGHAVVKGLHRAKRLTLGPGSVLHFYLLKPCAFHQLV